jgi:hypothetical protein
MMVAMEGLELPVTMAIHKINVFFCWLISGSDIYSVSQQTFLSVVFLPCVNNLKFSIKCSCVQLQLVDKIVLLVSYG